MTMTKRQVRQRLVDVWVVALCSISLAGGYWIAAETQPQTAPKPSSEAPRMSSAQRVPPVAGMIPAQRTRRVVIVRRSRAS